MRRALGPSPGVVSTGGRCGRPARNRTPPSPRSGADLVHAEAADDEVATGAVEDVDDVVARAARHGVVAGITRQQVAPGAAEQAVVAAHPEDHVGAAQAVERVIARRQNNRRPTPCRRVAPPPPPAATISRDCSESTAWSPHRAPATESVRTSAAAASARHTLHEAGAGAVCTARRLDLDGRHAARTVNVCSSPVNENVCVAARAAGQHGHRQDRAQQRGDHHDPPAGLCVAVYLPATSGHGPSLGRSVRRRKPAPRPCRVSAHHARIARRRLLGKSLNISARVVTARDVLGVGLTL